MATQNLTIPYPANGVIGQSLQCDNLIVSNEIIYQGKQLDTGFPISGEGYFYGGATGGSNNINTANTYVQPSIIINNFASANFGVSGATGNSAILYTGVAGLYKIDAAVQLTFGATGAAFDKLSVQWNKNGTQMFDPQYATVACGATGTCQIVSNNIVTLNPSDSITMAITDHDTTCNLAVTNANISIVPVSY